MEVLQVMIDTIKGTGSQEFSKAETSEAIRNALIEANGGSNKVSLKTCYRGSQIYSLIQELIPVIIDEGFKDDDTVFNFVEYRNIKDGDQQEFDIEGKSLFVVADAAAGIRGIRRQRLDEGQTVTVKTSLKMVRVYEELNRLLAGKVSFDKFVDNVAAAFKNQILTDAYKALSGVTSSTTGLSSTYVVAGTAETNESALETLIAHVEAATGKTARIYGTKAALKKLGSSIVADSAKEDVYNMGYYGKFNGTECVVLRQNHKVGTEVFAIADNVVYVIAGSDKPVKVVNEGDGILLEKDPTSNSDLTQEYIYGQAMGVAVVCSEVIGKFTIA